MEEEIVREQGEEEEEEGMVDPSKLLFGCYIYLLEIVVLTLVRFSCLDCIVSRLRRRCL